MVGSKAALVVARSAVFELVESLLLTYESCLWLCKRRRVVELQGFVESLLWLDDYPLISSERLQTGLSAVRWWSSNLSRLDHDTDSTQTESTHIVA